MVLNWVWVAFFVLACTTAVVRWWLGEAEIFTALLKALFDGARSGFEISLGLAGVMALWMGLMRVGERAGRVGGMHQLRVMPGRGERGENHVEPIELVIGERVLRLVGHSKVGEHPLELHCGRRRNRVGEPDSLMLGGADATHAGVDLEMDLGARAHLSGRLLNLAQFFHR